MTVQLLSSQGSLTPGPFPPSCMVCTCSSGCSQSPLYQGLGGWGWSPPHYTVRGWTPCTHTGTPSHTAILWMSGCSPNPSKPHMGWWVPPTPLHSQGGHSTHCPWMVQHPAFQLPGSRFTGLHWHFTLPAHPVPLAVPYHSTMLPKARWGRMWRREGHTQDPDYLLWQLDGCSELTG